MILRYGFHQTSECQIFEKAYLCIQKCLDLKYDVASSDKYCFCTCYIKKDKSKYLNKFGDLTTRWKLGAPTTSKPAWAQKITHKSDSMPSTTEETIQFTDNEKVTNTRFAGNSTESSLHNVTVDSSTIIPNNFTESINNNSSFSSITTDTNTMFSGDVFMTIE